MQAMETIKLLAGMGRLWKGKLLVCDFSDMDLAAIDISKSTRCPVCHGDLSGCRRRTFGLALRRDTANINPEKTAATELGRVLPYHKQAIQSTLKSRLALMFNYKGYEVSLFNGGRMLIKNVTAK